MSRVLAMRPLYERFCERPSPHSHFPRIILNILQIPHPLSPQSPNELENNLDIVNSAPPRSPERSAATPPTTFVESHEHDVLEDRFCADDPSDVSAESYTPRSSLRNESIFLDTGLLRDEFFDDTYTREFRSSQSRFCFSGLTKMRRCRERCIFVYETYVNPSRRNRIFSRDLLKHARNSGDNFFDKIYFNSSGALHFFFGSANFCIFE